ncbi:hypothetical protein B7494_g2032 [Chlorociboria aeruginascens]|nr:hypothetical protein B7494_g2032 [Chlorociboria aeruginascens]
MPYTSYLEAMCELAVTSGFVTEAEFYDHVKRTKAYVDSEERRYFPHTMNYIAEKFIWDTLLSSRGPFPGVDPRLSNPILSENPGEHTDEEQDEEDEDDPGSDVSFDASLTFLEASENSDSPRQGEESQDNAPATIPGDGGVPPRVPLQEISHLSRSPGTPQSLLRPGGRLLLYPVRFALEEATGSINPPPSVRDESIRWVSRVGAPSNAHDDEMSEEEGHHDHAEELPHVSDATLEEQLEILEMVEMDEKRNRRAGKQVDREQSDNANNVQEKSKQVQGENVGAITASEIPSTNKEECTICSLLFTNRAICRPCGHHFDRHCLQHWEIQNKQLRCPFCRNLVKRYDFVSEGSYSSRIPRRLIMDDFPCVRVETKEESEDEGAI